MWNKRNDTIVHQMSPFNAEPSRSALAQNELTGINTFYSRNHGPIPVVRVQDWRLMVDGMVDEALSLTFNELTGRFSAYEVVATLQCAGNRRKELIAIRDIPGEDPWGPCATSTARWRGARLGDVLTAAGVHRADGLHVSFKAPDVSDLASPAQPYGSSIPLHKALSDEVLLAWEMNAEPLPQIHGGPVRVVVPGYIGARSVKWVTGVTVQANPSANYFQSVAYRVLPPESDPDTAGPGDGISLSSVALSCAILVPDDGSEAAAGPLSVGGYAFAGDGRAVARVDVSIDGGQSWRQADLKPQLSRWSWRLWTLVVEATPGPLHLTARAWDTTGALQTETAASLWNPKGYVNNSWAHSHLTVRKRDSHAKSTP